MTVDYPPSPQILKKVFEAIIGALATSDKGTFLSEGTLLVFLSNLQTDEHFTALNLKI